MKRILILLSIFSLMGLLFSCSQGNEGNASGNVDNPIEEEPNEDQRKVVYRLAKNSGYEGTYEEWLESISGDQIKLEVRNNCLMWKYVSESDNNYRLLLDLSSLKGEQGSQGESGESAYELAVEKGYQGTLEEWLDSLKGEQGNTGESGVGILKSEINEDGDLIITYTNGDIVNVGHVVGDGNEIQPKVVETGKCGPDATWTYYDDKTFVISGSGIITTNYGMRKYVEFAHKLIIEKGIEKVEGIGNGFFVTEVEIPDSVTSIGEGAFSGFDSLHSIVIPDGVTSIGDMAFYNCSSLTSIEIPNSVTSIRGEAFYGCSSLTSIEIPNSVTSIGGYAFSGCSSLTIYCEVTSKPSGWNDYWNSNNRPVIWGYKE